MRQLSCVFLGLLLKSSRRFGMSREVPGLDRGAFRQSRTVVALRVPKRAVQPLCKALAGDMLRIRGVKPVQMANAEDRLLLLGPHIVSDLENLEESKRKAVEDSSAAPEPFEVELSYDNLCVEEVLKKLLPRDCEIPRAFEQAGHIAHLNLRDEQLPYKGIIAQVFLDKNPAIRTVVNKVGSIHKAYRTADLEVLAGDDDLMVELRETNCRFRFDYGKVYWNSRLATEHGRIVEEVPVSDIVCDMMAGVGPFALPLAKKGCMVYANDLNPSSYQYLTENAKINKCESRLHSYNMDGRDFVRKLVEDGVHFDRVLMNLPASALEFLDVFRGLWRDKEIAEKQLPLVQCYCFSKASDPVADVLARARDVLNFDVEGLTDARVRTVRDVAPQKLMMCLEFTIPYRLAVDSSEEVVQPPAKRPRTDDGVRTKSDTE